MTSACPLPSGALLMRYADSAYTDCYVTELPGMVDHGEFVTAFYTTPVFKLERLILRWLAKRPSTDVQAAQLATGETAHFAVWRVETRADNQLLLTDLHGRTRSWLMSAATAGGASTRLYFGSAVIAEAARRQGLSPGALALRALLVFHRVYSVILLSAARHRLAVARR